ncbi:GATA-4/5/6 transcription factor [Ostreococcus tauri]|uniref:GATA-4/5/6 transcription factor n=2 Tax=Ostreococcus tauri TaxID=70448 RepID=A0A1Y5I6J8_OSTTA|nr:GATA-4/5/6 transcription factor [Ostreococcus tauri]
MLARGRRGKTREECLARDLRRSDSAMTLRQSQRTGEMGRMGDEGEKVPRELEKVPRESEWPGARVDVDADEDWRRSTEESEEVEGDVAVDASAHAEVESGRRWYTRVRIYDDECSTAVWDAELAKLEASILSSSDDASVGGVESSRFRREERRWAPPADYYEEDEENDGGNFGVAVGVNGAGDARVVSVTSTGGVWDTNNENAVNTKSGGPCDHCGALESPQWRRGPAAKPMLCNACGTRYRRTNNLGPSPLLRAAALGKRKTLSQQSEPNAKPNARCNDPGSAKISFGSAMVF